LIGELAWWLRAAASRTARGTFLGDPRRAQPVSARAGKLIPLRRAGWRDEFAQPYQPDRQRYPDGGAKLST